jgi:hypothetical protein
MANYGFKRRSFRKALPVQVLTGFYPTEPVKLSYLAPPADNEAGESILSGMAIKKDAAGNFIPTEAGDSAVANLQVYIALHDSDSHDVQASGKLVGLDCSDSFKLLTAHYAVDDAPFALDDPLTVGAGGKFRRAIIDGETPDTLVVGYITAVGSNPDGSHPYQGHTPSVDFSTGEFDGDPVKNPAYIEMKTARHAHITVVLPAEEDNG